MNIKFKAYVAIKNNNNGWKRVEESIHETEEEAQHATIELTKKYSEATAGTHKYYILSRKEWKNEQYKGVSIKDGKTKTWMVNEGNGCALLFEGVHFEIVD